VSANELDQHSFVGVGDVDNEPAFVARYVENDAIVGNEIYRRAKCCLHIGRRRPSGFADHRLPRF
jgi:hypothetical protein